MAEDEEINNVIDFTERKLMRLEATFAAEGNLPNAFAMKDALERYKRGDIEIIFSGGLPYAVLPEEGPPELHEKS